MGLADLVLARATAPAALEQRSEWGSSAIPNPTEGVGGSYATVDLSTMEKSFAQVAVWSAIDLIASVSAQLPLDTYRKQPDGSNRNIPNPRVIEDPDGSDHGSQDWVYQYLVSKLGRGNSYGQQVRDDNGFVAQTALFHPDTVVGWRDRVTGQPIWRVDGQDFPASKMWHRRSYPMPGCLLGQSPLDRHISTIRLGIAATRFGGQFFSDGAHPSALLTNEEVEIDQPTANTAKARWMSAIYGTREPAVFGKGWKYQAVSLKPDESQFLETNKYTSAQCARIFGPNVAEILGYETGGSMTYANVVERSIDFLKFTLNRHLRDVEATMSRWLPRGQFVKFNRNALLETDLLSRFKAYTLAVNGRWMVPSEIRTTEDWLPFTPEQKAELEALPAPTPTPGGLK